MKKSCYIFVYGRVQGVGFRYSAKQTAHAYQIMGYVKNRPDGSVIIKATGLAENIDSFIQWCWQGPIRARVEDVKTEALPISQSESDFVIR